jgi:hypothetical protein
MRRFGGFIGTLTLVVPFVVPCVVPCVVPRGAQLGAQQVASRVSVAAGSATDVAGVTSRAVTLTPSVSIAPDPRVLFGAAASATRFDNHQWSLGGDATMATRAPLGRSAAFTLNGAASAATTSYDFSYTTASALPALELVAGPVTAYGGVQAAIASTRSVRDVSSPAGPFGPSPFASRESAGVVRGSRGGVFGGALKLLGAAGETAIVGVRETHATVDTTPTVDRSVSLSVLNGSVTVEGSAGVRVEPGMRAAFGGGAVSVPIGAAVALTFNAGSYPADRLIGTPAGRFFNLGVSMRTGRAPVGDVKVDGVAPPTAGMTRLALRDDGATHVEVAGDFTNWKPIATQRAANGVWFIDLPIPRGQYRYAFRVDGAHWKIPEGAAAIDDDFGGKSAWLTVSDPPSRSAR